MNRGARAAASLLAVLLAGCGGHGGPTTSTPAPPPVPGPIIGGRQPPVARDPLTSSQRGQASSAVRRFLSGYLPYLYGRSPAARVAPVTSSVARALRSGSARVTPAQRRQRPRVAALKVTGQTTRSALASVQVGGAGAAPFQLTLTVERRGGRWLISDLGDDG